MRSKYECLWEGLPYVAMVAVVCFDVGLTTLSKAAMDKGMSHFVFVVYSNALATPILLPSSFIFHRYPLTLSLLCRFFTLALIGSPTLGSALNNLTPAFTFILALLFRMEKFDIRNTRSQIKVMGTLVSISGALISEALIVTLYKGPSLGTYQLPPPITSDEVLQLASVSLDSSNLNSLTSNHWVLGGLFLAIASLSSSIWQIFQLLCNQCLVVSLIAEKKPNVWKLTPNLELVAILYSKGPVFVTMFTPVGIAVAAIMGFIFLGDTLYLVSLVGAAIIVLGFYGVTWGQSKEARGNDKEVKVNNVDGRARAPQQKMYLSCGTSEKHEPNNSQFW
ncbi:hypothetical protein MKW98_017934 [Papaver atlanticum]|uniref:WAT1-related protein n=1 Tax=Papaver atlanticum TaxID=357466 RepID=A0AAD4XVA6_9MAGN|nr:hypothetical protein MKW98_017934 [Papaver atlanticum]